MAYIRELELRYRRHAVESDGPLGKWIGSSQDVYNFFRYLQDVPQEKFLTIHLDTKCKMQSFREVSAGTLTSSLVDPAEVFRGALLAGVKTIIGVHNHPSGDPTPTDDDKALTNRIVEAGVIIGVKMIDHIIIGEGCHYSFKDKGLI
ncbi:MAG: JAB domain-containing protein [Deltaproteobacteria bacterium]|nr:JAB domain-containing protein [Deltaproteobacteria bacterium]